MEADVIIGADGSCRNIAFQRRLLTSCLGTRTITRRAILSKPVEVVRTNGCTYRALVPASAISSDPEIAHLLRDPNANCWIGPYRHLMTYPIRNRELYNLVMFHPGALPEGKTNRPLDLEEMKEQFKMFDPVIQKVLTYVQGGVKWQLGNLPSLPTWISPSGHVVLIGDAAHSMVPFLAQVYCPLCARVDLDAHAKTCRAPQRQSKTARFLQRALQEPTALKRSLACSKSMKPSDEDVSKLFSGAHVLTDTFGICRTDLCKYSAMLLYSRQIRMTKVGGATQICGVISVSSHGYLEAIPEMRYALSDQRSISTAA